MPKRVSLSTCAEPLILVQKWSVVSMTAALEKESNSYTFFKQCSVFQKKKKKNQILKYIISYPIRVSKYALGLYSVASIFGNVFILLRLSSCQRFQHFLKSTGISPQDSVSCYSIRPHRCLFPCFSLHSFIPFSSLYGISTFLYMPKQKSNELFYSYLEAFRCNQNLLRKYIESYD